MISITERRLTYPIALLLSIPGRKTFAALARSLEVSGTEISRLLENHATTMQDLIAIAKNFFKRKRLFLIIDDTLILKLYSKIIPGACDNYDSSDGNTYRSLCSVVAVITDGTFVIPIDQQLWFSREFAKDASVKKWEIAQKLILKIREELPIYMVLADGLYAVFVFLEWLISQDIKFEMRFHSNRVIDDHGTRTQVKNSPKFIMSGRRPKRTIKAKWYNIQFYFTALRRVNRCGKVNVIYQISNFKASAREHVQFYSYRWSIEKFFRTAKQKLGLNDCQSHKQKLHENHIFSVFLVYALLQRERKKNNLKNVESAMKKIKCTNFKDLRSHFMRSIKNF